jgi:predicted phosphodiesterase
MTESAAHCKVAAWCDPAPATARFNPPGGQLVKQGKSNPVMRLAIISDIHGNLEALRAVLADIDRSRIDAVACLGDNVGYGPEPEEVVTLLRQRQIPSVMGNHELGIVDPAYFNWFNTTAQRSLVITRRLLSPDTLNYIKQLPSSLVILGCLCVHGCPPDSITTYLFELSDADLRSLLQDMAQPLGFVGHTHELEIILLDGQEVTRAPLPPPLTTLKQGVKALVNVGSVGQPRDGNNNAKYVIWDDSRRTLEVRFIPYDIAATAKKIVQRGFPQFYARRLW